jgi:beta-phosphoglucomutase-like phosphatase (HAD superfamily)
MPAYWYSWEKTCQHYRLEFNEKRFYSLAGIPVRDIMKMLIEESHPINKPDLDEVVNYKKKLGENAVKNIGMPTIECVVEIAKRYHGVVPLAVASSGTKEHVIDSLRENHIYHLFDAIVTCEDVVRPKPFPDIFLEAARQLNVAPSSCVGFEDGDFGLEALQAAKMEAIDVRKWNRYPAINPSSISVLFSKDDDANAAAAVEQEDRSFRNALLLIIAIAILLKWFADLLSEAIKEEAWND